MNVENSRPSDVLTAIPNDLPEPLDDGACGHLMGMKLPEIELQSNQGKLVNLASIPGWAVLYIYPMTGKPGIPIPKGWAEIPGAAGCTPQSCSFRDSHKQFRLLDTTVYGVSTQSVADQAEAAERLKLPYELLSDFELKLAGALKLPLIEIAGLKVVKRVTLVCLDSVIKKYFYPVFPPNENASNVIGWLSENAHNQAFKRTI